MNLKNIKFIAFFLSSLLVFSGCDIANNKIEPHEEFVKILGNTGYDSKDYAIDFVETSDNGFIILSSVYSVGSPYVWHIPQITKTDKAGNILWQTQLEAPYVNPAGEIMEIGGEYYFFCMNETSLVSYLMKVNEANGSSELVKTFANVTYPLHSFKTSNSDVLLLGYNHLQRKSPLTKLSSDFSEVWAKEYPLIEDAEEMIISHITKTGKQFPLFATEVSANKFLLNCFYNYTFSSVFVEQNSGEISGAVNGFRYESSLSSIVETSPGIFTMSYYNLGDNFLLTGQEINSDNISSLESYSGTYIPGLEVDAKVASLVYNSTNGKQLVLASNTKSNEILLNFYEFTSGNLIKTKKISDSNPISVTRIVETSEGEIAILGETQVNGEFQRLIFIKTTD